MKITYLNNRFVNHENAFIHIDDRGYQFADGVYEVVLAKNDILIDWKQHCARLRRSLAGLQISYAFNDDSLAALVRELMQKNSLNDAVVYMQVTRGVAKREHGFPRGNVTPSVVITASKPALPSADEYKNGVAVITMPDIRWKRRDIKSTSLLPNILAKQAATEQNCVEAVLVEESGLITECSASNFFIFDKNSVLLTHPENNMILGGITRMGVLNVARQAGIVVEERAFNVSDLMQCSGAFVSSTTKHVLPVTKVNGAAIAGGVVCQQVIELMNLYNEYIEKQTQSTIQRKAV